MQQLHLVGFTTDHDSLIFSGRKGAKSGGFVLPLDEDLLATIAEAVRRRIADGDDIDLPAELLAPAPVVPRRQSLLSPREIQDRLRSGRSLEEISAEAGVGEEWVGRFAAPVEAERSQIVGRARALVYTKPRRGDSGELLGLSVRWNLADRGVRLTNDEFDGGWSAYQIADHAWMVTFGFVSRNRAQEAEWEVDLATGELLARNRLASDLGYVEPGRRRRSLASLQPTPLLGTKGARRVGAPAMPTPASGAADDVAARRGTSRGSAASGRRATGVTTGRKKAAGSKKAATTKRAAAGQAKKASTTKKASAPAKKAAPAKTAGARKVPTKAGGASKVPTKAGGLEAAAKVPTKAGGARKTAAAKVPTKTGGARKTATKAGGARKTATTRGGAASTRKAGGPPARGRKAPPAAPAARSALAVPAAVENELGQRRLQMVRASDAAPTGRPPRPSPRAASEARIAAARPADARSAVARSADAGAGSTAGARSTAARPREAVRGARSAPPAARPTTSAPGPARAPAPAPTASDPTLNLDVPDRGADEADARRAERRRARAAARAASPPPAPDPAGDPTPPRPPVAPAEAGPEGGRTAGESADPDGRVVTIRANRATPPTNEGSDVVVPSERPPLRPAQPAAQPRRRRFARPDR